MAECSESIGRSQASGDASGDSGAPRTDLAGAFPCERHHEMAGGDQRLLVRRRDDLALGKRSEDRPQAHDATGRDHDEVDVGPRRDRFEDLVAAADAVGSRRQVGRGTRSEHRRPAGDLRAQPIRLVRQRLEIPPGGDGDDAELVRKRGQDVDRLAADGSRRAEDRDADGIAGLSTARAPGAPVSGQARPRTG